MAACCGSARPRRREDHKHSWAEFGSKGEEEVPGNYVAGGSAKDKPRVRLDESPDTAVDFQAHEPKWNPQGPEQWIIEYTQELGEGGFGHVCKCRRAGDATNKIYCAKITKKFDDTSRQVRAEHVLKREIYMMERIKSCKNVIQLVDQFRLPADNLGVIVMEYVESLPYKEIFARMAHRRDDARTYLHKLLLALNDVHSQGIVHRDIKSGNVLYNLETKELRLIDWGFADFYRKDGYRNFPGTQVYKAPELHLKYPFYDYAADMWSYGCIAAALLLQRTPFFAAEWGDVSAQMVAIGSVLGVQDYAAFLKRYEGSFDTQAVDDYAVSMLVENGCPPTRVPLSVAADQDQHRRRHRHSMLADRAALDFLDELLRWDPADRMTAQEALKHPYFRRSVASDVTTSSSSMEYDESGSGTYSSARSRTSAGGCSGGSSDSV